MATTNIDAVSEFKILTNSYQAEYGRAVGGQVQVVTKSGTQDFHGSGYWYGRRSGWNAETWTNNRAGIKSPEASRDDSGYTIGGPVFIPGVFNAEKRKLFFFWSQEFQRRNDPVGERAEPGPDRTRAARRLLPERRRERQPVPLSSATTATGLPCSAANTSGCFQDGGVIGRIPQNRLYAPGLAALSIFPQPNTNRGSGLNYASQAPDTRPRREEMLRLDYQATDAWRVTGRYMHNKDEVGAAVRHDVGRCGQQQPRHDRHRPADSRDELPGLRPRRAEQLDVARGQRREGAQLARLRHPERDPDAFGRGGDRASRCSSRTRSSRTTSRTFASTAAARAGDAGYFQTDRGPFTNQNTTWDIVANLTKVWGAHAGQVRRLLPEQLQAAEHLHQLQQPDQLHRRCEQPVRHRLRIRERRHGGLQHLHAGVEVCRSRVAVHELRVVRAGQLESQSLHARLRDALLLHDAAVGHVAAGVELRPGAVRLRERRTALLPGLHRRVSVLRRQPARHGSDVGRQARADAGQYRAGAVHRPSGPRFATGSTARTRPAQGIDEELQDGSSFRLSPRVGATYDITGKAETILRGGWGIFYDRPQGNMVFDMGANAPGVLVSTLQWGRLQDLTAAGGDPFPTLSLNPTAFDFRPPKVYQWNVGVQQKLVVRASSSTSPTSAPSRRTCCGASRERGAARREVPAAEPGSDARAELDAGRHGAAGRFPAAVPRLQQHPDVGLQLERQLPRAPDGGQPPLRPRVPVLGVLRPEQGADARAQQRFRHKRGAVVPVRAAELHRGAGRRAGLVLRAVRPAAQLRDELRVPDARRRRRRARVRRERLADLGHLPVVERRPVPDHLLDSGYRQRRI